MPSKSFYIIDGHAQIYRAYFAPFRDLTSPTGEPTKGTFVFTQWLLMLIERRKPDYLAMVIDEGGDEGVFRKAIFPAYKANRQKRPDDFGPQETRILQIVRDAGIPIFGKPGFEADDLIATFSKQLCAAGDFETFLVSKDKDLRQVVNDCVKMYDVASDKVIDADVMQAELGFRPEQAVDIQTLMGDSTDNVPGIPGVGPKTALELVKKYGRAEAVLEHLDELKPKMKENFAKYADRLPISRQLVTLRDDVEIDFDPEACKFAGLDTEALRAHLQTLGFTSLVAKLGPAGTVAVETARAERKQKLARTVPFSGGLFGEDAPADAGGTDDAVAAAGDTPADRGPGNEPAPASVVEVGPPPQTCDGCDYQLVDTDEKFAAFLAGLKGQRRFAFDTETDDLGAMKSNIIGMSFSWRAGTGFYVPVAGPAGAGHVARDKVLDAVGPILEDAKIGKVGHNIKYDVLAMRNAGVVVRGVTLDTMVAAFVLDASRMQYGIDRLAMDLLHFRKIATAELIGKGKHVVSVKEVPLDRVATYASEDADVALRLAELLEARLVAVPALKKLNDEVEVPLIDVLSEMEFNGIAVDPAMLRSQSEVLGGRIDTLRVQIVEAAGVEFNPDSPKQLGDVLFNRLKLKSVKRTKTGQSTDVEVLEKLADHHPVPKLVLDYRSLVKLKNTYLDNLTDYLNARTGRVHAHFNQAGAATGRLSCSDPNLQNIPIRTDEGRRIRMAFVPGDATKNVLLTADYSQIELRFLAHFTGEPALVESFARDEDIHKKVAAEVFGVPLEQVTREQRNYAKTINFGIIYGVTAHGLQRRIEGLTYQSADALIKTYNQRFPGIGVFMKKCVAEAQDQGYVETLMGRRRPIPEINSHIINMRNYAERTAINSVVQGSAADLIKIAMVRVHDRLTRERRPSRMLLQVHDELVFETPADAAEQDARIIREEMTRAMSLRVPLKVDIAWAKNWQEVK